MKRRKRPPTEYGIVAFFRTFECIRTLFLLVDILDKKSTLREPDARRANVQTIVLGLGNSGAEAAHAVAESMITVSESFNVVLIGRFLSAWRKLFDRRESVARIVTRANRLDRVECGVNQLPGGEEVLVVGSACLNHQLSHSTRLRTRRVGLTSTESPFFEVTTVAPNHWFDLSSIGSCVEPFNRPLLPKNISVGYSSMIEFV
jgi:hypothetical protein